MKPFFYILFFLLLSTRLISQEFNGTVVDGNGKPLNAVTVIVPEANQSILCDENGRFRLLGHKDNYTMLLRKPEYKDVFYTLSVTDSIFVLEKDSLIIPGFVLDTHAEAKAGQIMKELINHAPMHFDAVKYYKSNSYISGKLTLERIHSLIDKITYKLDNFLMSDFANKTFSQELYTTTEYIYPKNYEVSIDGRLGNIPSNVANKGVIEIQRGSIYDNKFGNFISPLSKNAFSYYRFKYLGHFVSDSGFVHKIKVESKLRDPELINGYLYIDENNYTVKYATIKSSEQMMEITTSIVYHLVGEEQYLPASYYSDIVINLIGVDGSANYYTSVHYEDVTGQQKKYYWDEDEPYYLRNKIKIKDDAETKGTDFWKIRRNQPFEHTVYLPDSLMKKEINVSKYVLGKLLIGDYLYGNDSSNFSLKYNGLKLVFRDYNYVDGLWVGNQFDLKWKFNQKHHLETYPYLYYTTARKRVLWGSEFVYNYNNKRRGHLMISLGSRSEDLNSFSMTRYQNYFGSLVLGENYNFFYQRDFAIISNSIHVNRKFEVFTSLGVERRSGLSNNTNFSLLGSRNVKPNMFVGERFDRTFYTVGVVYSPNSHYSITEAMDMYMKKVTPVFNVEFQEGFSSWQTNNSQYQKLKGGVSHNIQLNYFNWIDYRVEAGVFLNAGKNAHFTDFQHFGASDLMLNLSSLFDSFLLLDNYELQTNRYWTSLLLNYSGKYVMLKHIPIFQGMPITENIHLKTLFTPDIKSYIETGYSISFNRYFGVGGFVSLHNTKMKKIGVSFSFNLRALKFV